ncbi:lysozyme [Pleurocapsales cyanobacterium LEGE 10410]|nr:lysozyme [Pleurocapsales cyanobacterium LEGE 10410]
MFLKSILSTNRYSSAAVLVVALASSYNIPHAIAANKLEHNSYSNSIQEFEPNQTDLNIAPKSTTKKLKQQIVASNYRVLPETINLVKQYEGFSSRAYIDTSGLPVIGYGQSFINGRRVRLGQYITRAQADAALEKELAHLQRKVAARVKVKLNPYQLGALTSLVYNAGMRIVTNSTLIRKLNAGDYAGAAREFPRWNKANKGGRLVVFSGLTRRRMAEKKLFLSDYDQIASN